MHSRVFLTGWRFDPLVAFVAVASLAAYAYAAWRYRRRFGRAWPGSRTAAFIAGIATIALAIESPLDRAADARFTPHMAQHLILTDVAAPLLLLGAPLVLLLGAAPRQTARNVVALLRSRVAHVLGFPALTWAVFIVTLWAIHFSGFFEAALEHEPVHLLEHALYLGTALLFWMPVIAIGPTPWIDGPLAFPIRMVYLLVAMPAEGFLGFAIFGSQRILYPHYARAGLADQQAAGELMWIGSGLAMFVAFMLVGIEWSRHDRARSERADARASANVNANA